MIAASKTEINFSNDGFCTKGMVEAVKNKFDRSLSSSFSQMLPDDMYDRIAQNIVPAQERTEVISMEKAKKTRVKWISVAAAACVLLIAGVFSGVYYANNMAVDSVVNIDVNPSVEISTNKHDRVVKVTAINEDAENLLDGMNLKNTDLKVAVNAIIGAMAQKGYLADGEGGILVTVHNDDASRAQQVRNQVLVDLDDSLKSNHVTASVLNQTVSDDTSARGFADENGISIGKALFVLNLSQKSGMPDAAALAQMSLKEIAALVV